MIQVPNLKETFTLLRTCRSELQPNLMLNLMKLITSCFKKMTHDQHPSNFLCLWDVHINEKISRIFSIRTPGSSLSLCCDWRTKVICVCSRFGIMFGLVSVNWELNTKQLCSITHISSFSVDDALQDKEALTVFLSYLFTVLFILINDREEAAETKDQSWISVK